MVTDTKEIQELKFYLGIHHPADTYRCSVPYFLTVRRVLHRKKPLYGDWIMDSGGFEELGLHGKYSFSEDDYIEAIKRLNPTFAFCQDWMVEPFILKKTGLTLEKHQEITIESYLSMRSKCSNVLPVLQGQTINDYIHHANMYALSGVAMDGLFGVGSICRRQSSKDIFWILSEIKRYYPDIKLHGFGVKITAFKYYNITSLLTSADSMAYTSNG